MCLELLVFMYRTLARSNINLMVGGSTFFVGSIYVAWESINSYSCSVAFGISKPVLFFSV